MQISGAGSLGRAQYRVPAAKERISLKTNGTQIALEKENTKTTSFHNLAVMIAYWK